MEVENIMNSSFISMLLVLAILYFLILRPQQIQSKKRAELLNSLKVGDRVITIGGFVGTVKKVTDAKVFVEIAEGVTVEMLRNAISQLEEAVVVADSTDDEDFDDEDFDDIDLDDIDLDDDIYYDEDDVEVKDENEKK